LVDFGKVLELNPENAEAFVGKGRVYRRKKEYELAEANLLKAVHQFPDYPYSFNSLAWLWSSCPNPRFRNGPKAVEYATKANELTAWVDPYCLDTLAAAYAE